jgi:hypothetical protein
MTLISTAFEAIFQNGDSIVQRLNRIELLFDLIVESAALAFVFLYF